MSNAHAFRGEIYKGRFSPDDPRFWYRALASLEGKRVRLTLGPERLERTTPQLDYYWGVIVRGIDLWSGQEDTDAVHYELLTRVLAPMLPERFLKPLPNGEHLHLRPTTTVLSMDEMNEYIGRCRRYAYDTFGKIEFPDDDQVSLRPDNR